MDYSDTAKIVFIILYFLSMIIQIFIPCYFGSIIYYKSKNITTDIYESNWINQSKQFKRCMMIFVAGTFNSIETKAGGLFTVNLGTFLSVNRAILT